MQSWTQDSGLNTQISPGPTDTDLSGPSKLEWTLDGIGLHSCYSVWPSSVGTTQEPVKMQTVSAPEALSQNLWSNKGPRGVIRSLYKTPFSQRPSVHEGPQAMTV